MASTKMGLWGKMWGTVEQGTPARWTILCTRGESGVKGFEKTKGLERWLSGIYEICCRERTGCYRPGRCLPVMEEVVWSLLVEGRSGIDSCNRN